MTLLRIATVAVVLGLAGCAASYTPPTSGPTARLRVVYAQADQRIGINVNQYKSGRCEDPVNLGYFSGSLNTTDFKPIGIPGARFQTPNQYLERKIEAESRQLLSVRFVYQDQNVITTCFVSRSFVPSSGSDYEMLVGFDHNGCGVRIRRILGEAPDHLQTTPELTARQEESCKKGFN